MSSSGSGIFSAGRKGEREAGPTRAAACPVCGGREFVPWKRATFDTGRLTAEHIKITDSEYGKIWDLSLCRGCGHIFADPAPLPGALAALYARVEDPGYEEEASGRAQNFGRILDRLERHLPDKGRLLDVGAATGILLDLARRRGWTPDGVEVSGWAAGVASRKYGLGLRVGDFVELDIPRGEFEAVTMVDIIEHLARPAPAAAKAWQALKPGGVLCLVTPDIHSPAARLAGRRWWHLRPGHLAYFSLRSLTTLLGRAGFRVLELRRYAWTFSAQYLISRLPLLRGAAESESASFLRRIPIKLALGDSFEIYAGKVPKP